VSGGDAVDAVLAALRDDDAERLRLALHPYLRWTTADGVLVRGRTNVLALLATRAALARPAAYELRDGQVYRWRE
jgi:hypothetical protein